MSRILFIAEAILICTLMLLSCQGKDGAMGPAGPALGEFQTYIYSSGGRYTPGISIYFSQCRDIPYATVNDIPLEYFHSTYLYSHDIEFPPLDTVNIEISYTKVSGDPGFTHTSIIMPGIFEMIAPDTSQPVLLSPGEDLTAIWHRAPEATCYQFYFSISCRYRTQGGILKTYNAAKDSIIIDTSFVLPATRILPSDFNTMEDFTGFMELSTRRNAMGSGDSTDFHGDGYGFVWAWSYVLDFNFYVVDTLYAI